MPNTIISPLVHSPDEFAIVAMPTGESKEKIVAVQNQISALLGDAVWLTPPNALHSTLMEIICNTEYMGMTRKEHFEQWYKRCNDAARDVLIQISPFDVTFNELHASAGAVILKATNTLAFNAVRAALLERTALPAQTKLPPDITHCSIARYNQAIDLDTVKKQLQSIAVNVTLHVDHFMLMTDLGPDFHPRIIDSYALGENTTHAS